MVYYRKYRPQTIEELDSKDVREKLFAVLSGVADENDNPRLPKRKAPSLRSFAPHAFLFTGPKGLGKTSTARIVAKVINCQKRRDIEPCNKCDSCLSITNGTNLDVLEIDAASNRGIDEIRDLREKIKLSPIRAMKKVYIIDEVHMLTTEAFNALLKTLEEPPEHAVFILCTTELHKVPDTIASRCFHIGFRIATIEELARSFTRIAKGEKLSIDKDAIAYIASLSDGSFRDGAKIMEEIAAVSDNKKITKDMVEKTCQMTGIKNYELRVMEAIVKRDAKAALHVIAETREQGIDAKFFIEQLINTLHSQILNKIGIEKEGFTIYDLPLTIDELKELTKLLTKAYQETKYAVVPQLPLELLIIEWCLKEKVDKAEEKETPPRQGSLGRGKTVRDLVQEKKNIAIRKVVAKHTGSTPTKENSLHSDKPKNSTRQTDIAQRTAGAAALFDEFIQEVKLKNHSVAGVLRGCHIVVFENGKVILQTAYKFHKERLEEAKAQKILEEAAKAITGKSMSISVQLKNK